MYTPEQVIVPHWYKTFLPQYNWELLGYLPHSTDCWWYYAVEDEKSGKHVTACFGNYNSHIVCDAEEYFIAKGSSFHYMRKMTLPYTVFFMGCDDGDMLMRFKDKEEAMLYLNAAECFEDFVEMKEMLWHN